MNIDVPVEMWMVWTALVSWIPVLIALVLYALLFVAFRALWHIWKPILIPWARDAWSVLRAVWSVCVRIPHEIWKLYSNYVEANISVNKLRLALRRPLKKENVLRPVAHEHWRR